MIGAGACLGEVVVANVGRGGRPGFAQVPQHTPAIRPARRQEVALQTAAQPSDGRLAGREPPGVDRLVAIAADRPNLLLPLVCSSLCVNSQAELFSHIPG